MAIRTLLLLAALAGAQAQSLPVIYVIGDSTANNGNHRGWGDPLAWQRVRPTTRP